MPEYERKIYDGVLRLPHEVAEFLGDRVKIVADYRSVVIVKTDAPPKIVSESLRYLANQILAESKLEKKGGKKVERA